MYKIQKYKIMLVKDSSFAVSEKHIKLPIDAVEIIKNYLQGSDREHCIVLMLNTQNVIIGINTISMGSVSASIVHPREVFKPAILANATGIILAHNHPSGNCSPSQEDILLTRRIKEAGDMLGIQLLDHIIVTEDGNHCSIINSLD